MAGGERDPVQRGAEEGRDLQNVVTWKPRSALDRLAVRIHASIRPALRATFVLLAASLFVGVLSSGLVVAVTDPTLRVLVGLSVVPAALLVLYVWVTDVTTEPVTVVVATVVLGMLVTPIAGVVNDGVAAAAAALGADVSAGVASIAYMFLVVAVGEETIKLLAVRLYAFRDARFDTVVDGAVYGAVAGLGFALVENALYITSQAGGFAMPEEVAAVAGLRALAGPGHVIYSGIAGYYLGLAKFNREHAGPIVVKGLLIAAFLHGSYNTLAGTLPLWLVETTGVSPGVAIVGYILAFDGVAGLLLYRKLRQYRRAYGAVYGDPDAEPHSELTEFDVGTDEESGVGDGYPARSGTGSTPGDRPGTGSATREGGDRRSSDSWPRTDRTSEDR